MLKFEIGGKELKKMVDKVMVAMAKKPSLLTLKNIKFIGEENKLSLLVSTVDTFLQVSTENVTINEQGSFFIDRENIKPLLKMTDYITIEEMENKIISKIGKKTIALLKQNVNDFPEIPSEVYESNFVFKENDLLQTIFNMEVFTSKDEYNNKIFQCINFNGGKKRITALDGHRVVTKSIKENEVFSDKEINIDNSIITDLKKTLDKKSENDIIISAGKLYNRIKGKNFTYYQHITEGQFFNIDRLLDTSAYDKSFIMDSQKALDQFKFYEENKDINIPMVLKIMQDKLITYMENSKIITSDEIEIKDHNGKELSICFNPSYLVDALNIVNGKNIKIMAVNRKAPLYIEDENYKFILLPVNANEAINKMENYLKSIAA